MFVCVYTLHGEADCLIEYFKTNIQCYTWIFFSFTYRAFRKDIFHLSKSFSGIVFKILFMFLKLSSVVVDFLLKIDVKATKNSD